MIHFKNLTKTYERNFKALDNITLEINDGEFVSIVGPSGAGKSTLLKMLTREEIPTKGSVTIGSVDLASLKSKEIPILRRKIGTIFQDFKLLSNKTASENIAFALEVADRTEKEIKENVPQVLKIVGLEKRADIFPHQMSGGEKQRLAIARALIHRPQIVLADEPTGNLDLLNTYDVVKLLMKINEYGTTVLLATHNREIVNTVGKRVITLENGRVVKDQTEAGRYVI